MSMSVTANGELPGLHTSFLALCKACHPALSIAHYRRDQRSCGLRASCALSRVRVSIVSQVLCRERGYRDEVKGHLALSTSALSVTLSTTLSD